MSLKKNLITIWKNKNLILEGIKNSIFKKEDVEEIAQHRIEICKNCPSECYDEIGDGCMVGGTQPCCNQNKGGCGCSLTFKTRSLSSECPFKHWDAVLTEDEENTLNEKLGL